MSAGEGNNGGRMNRFSASGLIVLLSSCTHFFEPPVDLVAQGKYSLKLEQADDCRLNVRVFERSEKLVVRGERSNTNRKCGSRTLPISIEILAPDETLISRRRTYFAPRVHGRHIHAGTSFETTFETLPVPGSTIHIWQ